MPPESVLDHLVKLYDCQIEYLFTAGISNAKLPKFMEKGCLKKNDDGDVEFDFGNEVHIDGKYKLLTVTESELAAKIKKVSKPLKPERTSDLKKNSKTGHKRQMKDTPQKGLRRKLGPKTSTPR